MPTANEETILEAFRLARRADHRELRTLLHDDVTWHPAATAKWNPCRNADEAPHVLDGEAGEDPHPVLRRGAHALRARAPKHEQHLPERRPGEVEARDEPVLPERRCERERGRAAEERAVEVEERRGAHTDRPAAA